MNQAIVRRCFTVIAAASILAVLPGPTAKAERDISLLMSMDHHMVRADFIAVIAVTNQYLYTSGSGIPTQHVDADVSDAWHSRWAPMDTIEFNTNARFEHAEAGSSYLVLLSGGPWTQSPFTHRENSIFRILPSGELECSGGDLLYGVLNDGFFCAPAGTVVGEPMVIDEVQDRVLCMRDRAVMRLPKLDEELWLSVRKLELEPSQLVSEVQR
jgi:hypothetical protein